MTAIVKEGAVTFVVPESFPVFVVELTSTSGGISSGRRIASVIISSSTGFGKGFNDIMKSCWVKNKAYESILVDEFIGFPRT